MKKIFMTLLMLALSALLFVSGVIFAHSVKPDTKTITMTPGIYAVVDSKTAIVMTITVNTKIDEAATVPHGRVVKTSEATFGTPYEHYPTRCTSISTAKDCRDRTHVVNLGQFNAGTTVHRVIVQPLSDDGSRRPRKHGFWHQILLRV